ncbi:Calcium/calmodulin-dependent protein kinase type 1 [Danaus plexippus plexippus]|uniref:non-specific serine/threonine protein kinase n=1 Tax=Danaus plexippus plexippus TaxID=278856 RepID=A0A212F3Y9_DANPL|nr:serine/threonine-protein kinase GA29083 [Danaus plexippus plexippus]OWR48447.1 Calcium/calmodulin-dependent protein kinase type 1 [Danaus plexippus plexippus]
MENNLSRSGSHSSSVCELEKDPSDIEILKSRTNRRNVMIRSQPARKAKRIRFFRNGDKFYSGVIIPVLPERYRSFDSLTADLTRVLVDNVTLPSGVRTIYSLEGRKIGKLDDLEDGQSYVCSGFGEPFKKLDYEASAVTPQSFRLSGPESLSDSSSPAPARANNRISRYLQTNGSNSTGNGSPRVSPAGDNVVRPHIVTIIRNGVKPRKVCRLLLNKRNSPTLEHALAAITDCIKLDTGCVRKVFTQSGTPVTALNQFFEEEDVFFAYGNERVNQEDFELEFEESKAVLQCRKIKYNPVTRNTRFVTKKCLKISAAVAAGAGDGEAALALAALLPHPLRLKYNVGKIIGDGNFAVVRICKDKTTGKEYALKVIDKAKCKGKEHYVEAEVRVMRKLCHPRIVSLIEDQDSPEWLFLIMELVSGGDLFDSIAVASKFSEPQARLLIGHLTSAIAYLHSLSIVHRDIKPENLLVEVGQDGSIRGLKLADFGLAVEVWRPLHAVCGTPTYVAPEILLETGYGLKIDVWAAGVILYILLCGFPPFSSPDGDQEKLFDAILSARLEFPAPHWERVSAGAIDLVANMLRPQPELRFAAEDVLDHAWMSDDYDEMCDFRTWYDEDSS